MTNRLRAVAVLIATAAFMATSATFATATLIAPASPPSQPTTGPGSNGACSTLATSFDNAAAPGNPIYVFAPTGIGRATIGGGHCDDTQRPTVFIAHGLNLADPTSYGDMITHLVSVGNIVVYPTYQVNDGSKSTLEAAYQSMDAGIVQAVGLTSRVDTSRVGWWGHSMGGSMIPYLVEQGGTRGWGSNGLWMNNIAMTFALLVGPDDITVPPQTQNLTIGFEDDELADNRVGNEVFEALTLPATQKHHVTLNTDVHGQPVLVADHTGPSGGNGTGVDAVDFALWRDHDLLETCALSGGRDCRVDYSFTGTWSDGTPVVPATVAEHPVDVGPYPALLAECDGVYGQQLNQERMHRCGPTHIT